MGILRAVWPLLALKRFLNLATTRFDAGAGTIVVDDRVMDTFYCVCQGGGETLLAKVGPGLPGLDPAGILEWQYWR